MLRILPDLSRTQVQILQVFLMILIILHNTSIFLFTPRPLSEFDWQPDYFFVLKKIMLNNWATHQLWQIIPLIFTCMGYTAVYSFVILTAYGLSKRYPQKPSEPFLFLNYFKRRLVYLGLPWLLTGLWLECMLQNPPSVLIWFLNFSTLKIWIPHNQYLILGPWWFLAMIFEIYLIFPLLLKLYRQWRLKFLLLLCLIQYGTQILINPWAISTLGLNLNLTPLGYLIPLSMGLFWAENPFMPRSIGVRMILAMGFVLLFFAAQQSFYTWPIANTAMGLALLILGFFGLPCTHHTPKLLRHLITLIVPMYLIHGYVLSIVHPWLKTNPNSLMTYCISLLVMGFMTYLSAYLLRKITDTVTAQLTSPHNTIERL